MTLIGMERLPRSRAIIHNEYDHLRPELSSNGVEYNVRDGRDLPTVVPVAVTVVLMATPATATSPVAATTTAISAWEDCRKNNLDGHLKDDLPLPPPPPLYIAISSSCGGTVALASRRIPISSRADLAFSVVKYVYEVPFIPARYKGSRE